ncbi:MAG: extracellular solute-binding protein [Anaerolineae bacterium]|nr:extracellular solute-binding protein [Anaerolineae bacterium]
MNPKKIASLAALSALILAACAAPPAAAPAQPAQPAQPAEQQPAAPGKKFAGVTVNAITFSGPQIAEPMQRRGKEFSEMTGATINVVTVPFADLYQKILNDFATGTNSFDVIVFAPQWMVDYIEPGYLEDLTDRVKADSDLQWDDIGLFFRDFSATYNGRIYTIPLDGDFQMVYYRTDIAKELGLQPPKTWDDYIAFAKAVSEKKLTTDDGKPVYGSCIAKKKAAQSYWMITSVASAFIQSQGTGQGAFFDLETFKPLYNNEAFARALEVYKETTQFGPPDEINLDVGDTRGLWTAGQCALTIDWGDIGTLAIEEGSKAKDKTGAVILPGSKQVLDRKTGKLVDCTPELCPHAIDGVNHAPFAAFGGWSGAINKASKPEVKDAAFAYLSYMNQPAQSNVDVTIGKTGFNPYRVSQFKNLDNWLKAGMSEQAAKDYLGAIEASLNSPNMVLDLRIPQNQYYQGIVLDGAIAKFLAGEQDLAATMKEIEDGWEQKTEELGRDKQLAAYRSTLGVQK